MASDLFSTVKSYISKVADGEHSPAELANSINTWIKESTESIKVKVEDEVERSVSKMGFIKRTEFEELKRELITLKSELSKTPASQGAKGRKSPAKKVVKKSPLSAKKSASGVKKKATPKKASAKMAPKPAGKGK